MNIWEVFYKQTEDLRAPAKIYLTEYSEPAEIKADNRPQAASKWMRGEDKLKPPQPGDLLKSPEGRFYILTPEGLWAEVEVG